VNTDTPLPPEEPAGKNPPDGAILNYCLREAMSGPVTLEIFDAANKLVRRFSSADKPEPAAGRELVIATYWLRPPQTLSTAPGMQRFVWDLHYPPPEGARRSYPMTAIYQDTPSAPRGPAVLPGEYRVKLTVNGRTYEQPLTVKMDPRVKTPPEGLAQQFALAMRSWEGVGKVQSTLRQVRDLRARLQAVREKAGDGNGKVAEALAALDRKAAALEGAGGRGGPRGGFREAAGAGEPSLTRLNAQLTALLALVEGADAAPTTQAVGASDEVQRMLTSLLARWGELRDKEVKAVDEELRRSNLPLLGSQP
jgi:hypothetical protein